MFNRKDKNGGNGETGAMDQRKLLENTLIRPHEMHEYMSGKKSMHEVLYAPYTPCGDMFVRTILPFIPTSRRGKQYVRSTTPGATINYTHRDSEAYTKNTIVDVTYSDSKKIRSRESHISPLERAHVKNSLQLTKDSTAVVMFRKCLEKYSRFYEVRERNLKQKKNMAIDDHFTSPQQQQQQPENETQSQEEQAKA